MTKRIVLTLEDCVRALKAANEREARLREWVRTRSVPWSEGGVPWSEGYSDEFKRGYDAAVEEVAALATTPEGES